MLASEGARLTAALAESRRPRGGAATWLSALEMSDFPEWARFNSARAETDKPKLPLLLAVLSRLVLQRGVRAGLGEQVSEVPLHEEADGLTFLCASALRRSNRSWFSWRNPCQTSISGRVACTSCSVLQDDWRDLLQVLEFEPNASAGSLGLLRVLELEPNASAGSLGLLRVLELEPDASAGSTCPPFSLPATSDGAAGTLGLLSPRMELSAWEEVLSAAGVHSTLEGLDMPPNERSELLLLNFVVTMAEPLGDEQLGAATFISPFEAFIPPFETATDSTVARVSRKA